MRGRLPMDPLPGASSARHGRCSTVTFSSWGDCQQLPPHGLFLGQCSSSLPTRDGCHSLVRAEEHGQGSGMAPLHGMADLGDTFCGILDM